MLPKPLFGNSNLLMRVLPLAFLCLFIGCAVKPKQDSSSQGDPYYYDKTNFKQFFSPIKAVFKLRVWETAKKSSSATLVVAALPNEKYVLEVMDPFGMSRAKLFWKKDSLWTLYIPKDKVAFTGSNGLITLPFMNLEKLDIEQFLDFIWEHPIKWSAKLSKTDSLGNYTRVLKSFAKKPLSSKSVSKVLPQGAHWAPELIQVFDNANGNPLAELRVRKISYNAEWKKPPFFLSLPKDVSTKELE